MYYHHCSFRYENIQKSEISYGNVYDAILIVIEIMIKPINLVRNNDKNYGSKHIKSKIHAKNIKAIPLK